MRNDYYGTSGDFPSRNIVPRFLQEGEIDLRGIRYVPDYLPQYPRDIDPADNYSRQQIVPPEGNTVQDVIRAAVTGLGRDLTVLSLRDEKAYRKVGISARFVTALEVRLKPEKGPTKRAKPEFEIAPTKRSKLFTVAKQPGHLTVKSTQQRLYIAGGGKAYTLADTEGYEVQDLECFPSTELNGLITVRAYLDQLRAAADLVEPIVNTKEPIALPQKTAKGFIRRAFDGSLFSRKSGI